MGQDKEKAWRVSTVGGVFIVFEGGDGVGKTTQVEMLCEWLADAGHEVVKTFEPGDSPVGAMIVENTNCPIESNLIRKREKFVVVRK